MAHSVQRTLAAASALSAALFLSAPALAGSLQLRDGADLLTPDQESALRASSARYDFDACVLTDTRFTTRDAFERHVAAQLTAPGMVVVGIDPAHRWTAVHYGTSTRIATARFGAIENAGDTSFRAARWADGVVAILDAAQSSVGTATGRDVGRAGAPAFPWGTVFFGLLVVGGIALATRVFRRARGGDLNPSDGRFGAPQVPGPYYGPNAAYGGGYGPYGGYGPTPGSSVGAGLAGAALGGLAGYALGNAMGHRDEHGTSNADMTGGADSPDAGGSASGWDDGGGGGDFGGGGGDGGGDW